MRNQMTPIEPESKLGPYEIVDRLGSGGMGEVYRARDRRLGREVAIKVLLPTLTADPERLRRFEQEAKAVALLNHPGILQIYDTGMHEGTPYLVMELLEGQNLRDRMDGHALPLRKALDFAHQIARGLAAAHAKGLTHRDLKPENVFLTRDERVKILDFGLAKLRADVPSDAQATQDNRTLPMETRVGTVVGTASYMSPEQVNGLAADARSDIFALGVILWEMLAGSRPFGGDSPVEVMHAVLKTELPDFPAALPPTLDRLLHRCMEKSPEARFQSAQDLAFELENLLMGSGASGVGTTLRLPRVRLLRKANRRLWIGLLLAAGLAVAALVLGRLLGRTDPPTLHRLTYRTGQIQSARFTPDGRSFVFGLSRPGAPTQLYLSRIDGIGAQPLDLPQGAELLSVSSTGEMALLLPAEGGPAHTGVLARAPLGGGAPREVLEKVYAADWAPDGRELAVVRVGEGGRQRLEYPVGRVLIEVPPPDTIDSPRVSPDGQWVAFSEIRAMNHHLLTVVDRQGRAKVLATGDIKWLGWAPDSSGVLYTQGVGGDRQSLRVISLSGRDRAIYSVTGRLDIQDASKAGKILVRHTLSRMHLFEGRKGEGAEREISWLQSSKIADLTRDGRGVLFAERREGIGPGGAYFRKGGADPVRLGDGDPLVVSPDGKWVAVRLFGTQELGLLPTGPGEARRLPKHGVKADWVLFLDARRLLLGGAGADKVFRYFVQDIDSGAMKPWIPEPGAVEAYALLSPDGTRIALAPVDGKARIYTVEGVLQREIAGVDGDDVPLHWSGDGRDLFLGRFETLPAKIWRFDLATGKRRLHLELQPPDAVGVEGLNNACITPDGLRYAYSFDRILTSDLYLMEGWK